MRDIAGRLEAERDGDRALRIGIDDQNAVAPVGKITGQRKGRGRLTDAAPLVRDDNFDQRIFSSARNWRMRSTSCGVHNLYFVMGWRLGSEIFPLRSQL